MPNGAGESDRLGRKITLTGVLIDIKLEWLTVGAPSGSANSPYDCRFIMGFMTAAGDNYSS